MQRKITAYENYIVAMSGMIQRREDLKFEPILLLNELNLKEKHMNKFRKAIQVGRNATDILELPCVIGCKKEFWSDSDIRLRFELFGDTQSTKFRWGESICAYHGDWLCEDYDGVWYLLSNEEYEKQKGMP